MTKKDLVVKALESMGYKPKIDNDGDVMFHYQMKLIYTRHTDGREELPCGHVSAVQQDKGGRGDQDTDSV